MPSPWRHIGSAFDLILDRFIAHCLWGHFVSRRAARRARQRAGRCRARPVLTPDDAIVLPLLTKQNEREAVAYEGDARLFGYLLSLRRVRSRLRRHRTGTIRVAFRRMKERANRR